MSVISRMLVRSLALRYDANRVPRLDDADIELLYNFLLHFREVFELLADERMRELLRSFEIADCPQCSTPVLLIAGAGVCQKCEMGISNESDSNAVN